MKYERLKEHTKNAKKYERLADIFIGICCICILALPLFLLLFEDVELAVNLIAIDLIIACITGILAVIFTCKQAAFGEKKEDYIVIKIMDLISNNISDFEWVKDPTGTYVVGFHNQIVDYDELEKLVKPELKTMNNIANTDVKIRFI